MNTEIITVDPKVMEPNDPIPGRVPRKVNVIKIRLLLIEKKKSMHLLI